MRVRAWIAVAAAMIPAAVGAAGSAIMPGQWEITTTVKSMEMPGAPPGIAAMMTGKATTIRHCITPEDAARGPQDLLTSDKACRFTRYSLVGGKFDSEMVCRRSGGTTTATSTGTFTPTGFVSTARSVMGGGTPMTMVSQSIGRRTGACK